MPFLKNNSLFFMLLILLQSNFCYSRSNQQVGKKFDIPFQLLDEKNHQDIVIYDSWDNQKHSYITFIKDKQNECYLVKQDKSMSLKAQFQVALEKLAAYIAACINISAHQVEILSVGLSFPGKMIQENPATIHTLMPGICISNLQGKLYSGFSINQGGNPNKPAQGLTIKLIKYMATHKDLPPIVALDTFIANRDRSRKNLLRDQVGDRFYAIDMGLIYDVRPNDFFIPSLVCKNVELMIENKVTFKKRKLRAMHSYYETLLKLLENFPPEKTYTFLFSFLEQAGLLEKYCNVDSFRDLLEKYKKLIEKAYDENKRLVYLLSQLLKE